MKSNDNKRITKKDIILFICVWIFAMIANNAFLQRHYSSDTMCLLELGYFAYPTEYFLLDGRIISTLVCYLGGVLNLPVDTYLFISNFIGIIMLALTVVILFKFIIKYLEIDNKWIKLLVLISSYTIILNHMSIEFLLYPESCVMCAGVLFSVIASISYLNPKKGKKFESFCWLLLSALCYQAVINVFPVLVLTLSFLKIKNTKKEIFKNYIKEVFKLGIMFVLALLVCVVLVAVYSKLLGNSSNRIERIQNLIYLINQLPYVALRLLLDQNGKAPNYIFVFVMTVTNLIVIRYTDGKLLLKYILIIITAYVFCVVPLAIYGYATTRLLMAIGSMMGISLLFITKVLNDNATSISIKNVTTVIISILVIGYFIFNVTNNYINSYEHLKAFALDEQMGAEINEIVKEYEKNSGIEVRKFAYCYDDYTEVYQKGIKSLGSLTERKFAMTWCIRESVGYYCGKRLIETRLPAQVYYENFFGKSYSEFSDEQLVFVGDTLYMYVY